jgi:hypothetical protein
MILVLRLGQSLRYAMNDILWPESNLEMVVRLTS